MSIDYFGKLKEAFNFTMKYKFLWVFGFILVLCSGSKSFDSNNWNSNSSRNNPNTGEELRTLPHDLGVTKENLIEVVIIVTIVLTIVIILCIVAWYLSSMARGALIKSVQWDAINEQFSFKKAWRFGVSYAPKFMVLDLLLFLLFLPFFLPWTILGIVAIVTPSGADVILLCLACILAIPYFILFAFTAILRTIAHRYLVLREQDAWQTIKSSFALTKRTIIDYIVGWFVALIPGCVGLLVMGTVMMFFVVVVIVMVIVAAAAGSEVVLITLLCSGLATMLVTLTILSSPFAVFLHTYWTKITMELMDKKDPIADAKK